MAKFEAQVTSLVLTSVTGWVDPRDMVRPRMIKPIKYPNDFHRNSNPRPSGLWRNSLRYCATNRKRVASFLKRKKLFVSSENSLKSWNPMVCYRAHKSRSIDSLHDPLGSSSRPHVTTFLEDYFKSILPCSRLCITPYKVGNNKRIDIKTWN